ncbi:CaiB/BaiF CoA-transferase family protein [Pulveribacter sp.]|uniref:CaiB/BaiF CoA transferase family protein n=1 Tax=Pulveribacter sp. TaxID=2678893 RepID=UPI0028A9580B|nr:CaiB/BaiF CoA-transferase family protein [Pulveribacter sp.]
MSAALSHLRVLDMSRILAGPWASQTLADLGAEVIKIERPAKGDDTRAWGPPFLKDQQGRDTSETAYFLCANRGKKSLTLDIAAPAGQDIIRRLAAQSDVLIENFKVGDLARYGLSYEDLKQVNPNLIYCSITGFGQSGPFSAQAGYDFMIQGTGGLMSLTGTPDGMPGGGPQKVGVPVADLMTGMYATVAILAALTRRDRQGGGGEYIDMALFDCQLAMLSNQAQNYLISGSVPRRYGNAHPNVVPYQAFPTQDGHIIVAIGNDFQFGKFCEAAGEPAVAQDPRFLTNADRVRNRQAIVAEMERMVRRRTTQEWLEDLGPRGVPCGPINTVQQSFAHPQAVHRGMQVDIEHPANAHAKVPLVANPIRFSEHPIAYDRPPPLLGEHTRQVLHEVLGLSEGEVQTLSDAGVL